MSLSWGPPAISATCLFRGCSRWAIPCDASRLVGREWASKVEVFEGDVLDLGSLGRASHGMDAAYYLVHSMGQEAGSAFVQRDHHAASNMALVAREVGLGRLIYLGGLGEQAESLSQHLASRQEVGRVLAAGGAPVTAAVRYK